MRMWLLTVGEYADEETLGVVRANDIAEARRVASAMTAKRVLAGESDDMTYVAVTEVEDLTPENDRVVRATASAPFNPRRYADDDVILPITQHVRLVRGLQAADEKIDHIFAAHKSESTGGMTEFGSNCLGGDLTALGNWVRAALRLVEALTK